MKVLLGVLLLVVFLWGVVENKDPAQGWMGYATAQYPAGSRLTYIEAKWKVPNNPVYGGAFFSPWFGIESSDNMNLIQPVNPWNSYSWLIYNEYYQWEPTYNFDSDMHVVQPGDVLFGSVRYSPGNNSYVVFHADLNDGWGVYSTIPIQFWNGGYKNYTLAYFVMEKVWNCNQYPPDGIVTFYDIKVEYDNAPVTPQWSTGYVDDNCNCRAHILNPSSVSITWSTN